MYNEIQCKEVTCRKEHNCEWCNESVEKSSKAIYRAYVFEGDFNSGWMHKECFTAMEESRYDFISEGWVPGEQKRGERI